MDLREEAAAVEGEAGEAKGAGGFHEGGEEVGGVDEIVAEPAGGVVAGPAGEEGDAHARFGGEAFAAGDGAEAHWGGDFGRRAVVGVEKNDGVVGQAEAVEVGDHVLEVVGIVFEAVGGGPVVAAGGGVEGAVGEGHGVVGEEGLVAMAGHKVDELVGEEIGAVLVFDAVHFLPILLRTGLP